MLLTVLLSLPGCRQKTLDTADTALCRDAGAAEEPYDGLDNDCDPRTPDDDLDGDGFPAEEDCDDANASVNPDATEVCNGVDDDCSGQADDAVGWAFHADEDGDGYGDPATEELSCEGNPGWVSDDSDCDDSDPAVNVAADELCDGVDNDCDGDVDEDSAVDAGTWYADEDGDGYGGEDSSRACEAATGFVGQDGDCEDQDASVNPGADELCNGVDDDCDGSVDRDALDAPTWYIDYDSDGYGSSTYSLEQCDQPDGYVAEDTDCDDTNADVSPLGAEVCNEIDDDCDALVDDDDPSMTGPGSSTWYADADGDGFGDAATTTEACEEPSGYVRDDTDCDDGDANSWPSAPELCDGADNDCDGVDDTLGYWAFDTGTGAVAYDSGDLGLDADIVDASWTTAGYSGAALDFDGGSSYVSIDHTELEAADGLTVSVWVQPDSLRGSSWDSVVSRGSAGTGNLGCCGDSYYLGYYLAGLSWYTAQSSTMDPLLDGGAYSTHIGSWHHLLATWDPATGTRVTYVDGAQTATDTKGPAALLYDGTPTVVGADVNSGSQVLFFDGLIDEVKIFGCAVDGTQAAADYSANWPF